MPFVFELLKYILPSVVVFLTAFYILKAFFEQEQKRQETSLKMGIQEKTLPVQIQAYERLVLLLERMQAANLVLRSGSAANVQQMQAMLVQNIRDEFDHNLSQQLYVSFQAWEMVCVAKEDTLKLISTAASQLPENAQIADLAGAILSLSLNPEKTAVQMATDFLKKEARMKFF